MQLYTNQVM